MSVDASPGEAVESGPFDALIDAFLAEDLAEQGDLTSRALVPAELAGEARFLAKQEGVLSGLDVALRVFELCDPSCRGDARNVEGDRVVPGDVIGTVHGPARALLAAERTALNLLQRMSGIATLTARFVRLTQGTSARILDTRKTAPGLRPFDKRAVLAGGGDNHRYGLFDQILIKENHIAWMPEASAAGEDRAIEEAVHRARVAVGDSGVVEIEVFDTLEAVRAAAAGADIVLLDNFAVADLADAVAQVRASGSPALLEASGGVDLDTVAAIAASGVDRISVGALTHSVPALDVSLLIEGVSPPPKAR